MRPSAFTDGNAVETTDEMPRVVQRCFNEAVGFHRRKPGRRGARTCLRPWTMKSFNEAVGFHRRKPLHPERRCAGCNRASMRPSAFTDGNIRSPGRDVLLIHGASMRPSAFTDGNRSPRIDCGAGQPDSFNEAVGFHRRKRARPAWSATDLALSMRPSAFTDGNAVAGSCGSARSAPASMRPSAFTDGNAHDRTSGPV